MKTILLIDDEEDLRVDIVEELQAAGYAVAEAGDGRTGLEMIVKGRPDLVLCDISMPGWSGYDVLDRLRTDHPDLADTPFVFLTALADRSDITRGKRSGADDYLTKPIDFDDLLATVEARLRQVTRMVERKSAELEDAQQALLTILRDSSARSFQAAAGALNRLSFGVFLVSSTEDILYSNQAGQRLLKEGDALFQSGGKLRAAEKDSASALTAALKADTSQADTSQADTSRTDGQDARAHEAERVVTMRHRADNHPLIAVVTPLKDEPVTPLPDTPHPAYAVFVSDPEQRNSLSIEAFASAYGLSATETGILSRILDGDRPADIADSSGRSRHTVNNQLKSIFRKTGTDRQSELVGKVMAALGWR